MGSLLHPATPESETAIVPKPGDHAIEVVLFDMGGVLVQLGNLDEELGVQGLSSQQFWDRWLTSPAVRSLERGDADVDGFADALAAEFNLDMDRSEVIARFTGVPRGLFPGAVELVRSVREGIATGVLSNTNKVHWETQPDNEIVRGMFEHNYVSYQIGLMKPDREIYDHVIADLGTNPAAILFIDDNQMNVDGARAAGMRSELAKGPEQASGVLAAYGLQS